MSLRGGESTYSSTGSTKPNFVALTRYHGSETLDYLVKGTMKNITKLLSVAGLALAFATCASADVTWVLNNVTFSDGATASGFFTTDPGFDTLDNWDINVTGSDLGADYHYLTTNSSPFDISASEVSLASNPFAKFVILFPSSPMTNAGGTISLVTGFDVPPGSGDCAISGACGHLGSDSTASITGTATPEPRFGAVLLAGLAGLGFLTRRKFAAVRS